MSETKEFLERLEKKIDNISSSAADAYKFETMYVRFKNHAWYDIADEAKTFMCIKCRNTLKFTGTLSYTLSHYYNEHTNCT